MLNRNSERHKQWAMEEIWHLECQECLQVRHEPGSSQRVSSQVFLLQHFARETIPCSAMPQTKQEAKPHTSPVLHNQPCWSHTSPRTFHVSPSLHPHPLQSPGNSVHTTLGSDDYVIASSSDKRFVLVGIGQWGWGDYSYNSTQKAARISPHELTAHEINCKSVYPLHRRVREVAAWARRFQRSADAILVQDMLNVSNLWRVNWTSGSRDGVVSIATRYGLKGPGIESRWGARFSAPIQTGSEVHPASCTMGTGSFPGVKAAGAWRWLSTPCSAEVHGKE
jgi:hypothetical protein